MQLTCTQMDVLISFYIENELSKTLKAEVEEHLKNCASCRAKYDIIKSMISDLKNNFDIKEECTAKKQWETATNSTTNSQQYHFFRTNLSSYMDNELSNEDNLKIKKFTINNKKARKELEDNYNIRKLMSNSFNKTKNDSKIDFSKSVLKQLELDDESVLGIHPAIKLLIFFTISVLVLTSFVLMTLSV